MDNQTPSAPEERNTFHPKNNYPMMWYQVAVRCTLKKLMIERSFIDRSLL